MFSYRHAFHAGNHADVLKHTTLIAIAQYLVQKDTPLSVIDTHAGAGLYRLDGDFAQTSGEAMEGIARMLSADPATLAPALQTYLAIVQSFNPGAHLRTYPGSPALLLQVLRPQDKLRLFELMPQDARALLGNAEQLLEGRQAQVLMEDGFANAKKFLPPPDRRGLLLCDPSYEMKTDYAKVATFIDDSLRRFATGCYAVWYPIIGRARGARPAQAPEVLGRQGGQKLAARHAHRQIGQAANPGRWQRQTPGAAGQRHVHHQPAIHLARRVGGGPAADGGADGAR